MASLESFCVYECKMVDGKISSTLLLLWNFAYVHFPDFRIRSGFKKGCDNEKKERGRRKVRKEKVEVVSEERVCSLINEIIIFQYDVKYL